MTHYYNANHTAKASALHRALLLVICFISSSTSTSFAQTIGGNVYGAGNQGDVGKSSTVTLKGGTIMGDVYGGARMANVGEYSYVNIDGENATDSLIVKSVYGGNDIAGIIGNSSNAWTLPDDIKTKFSQEIAGNTFIYSSTNTQYPVIIGSLYGGGNGDYTYTAQDRKFNVAVGSETFVVENKPELNNTHIKLLGGIYGHIYGGGNKATITYKTTIHWENGLTFEEDTLNRIPKENARFLGLSQDVDYIEDGDNMVFTHHVSRMFGGNNLATMSIRPTWNLIKGSINNLYSGGNKGEMTNANGLLLPLTSAGLTVNNVYGGCRMADVNPGLTAPGADNTSIQDFTFPAGYSARVYITAGNITNVYGGNDISGKVHYGTNLEIFSNISGDIYGGGNGSYAYTDKETASDYYYSPGENSADALFNFRPNIEKTLIHIAGNDAQKPLNLRNVYCGGNSAPIYSEVADSNAILKLGNNVASIENVFLGSNGANMATEAMLNLYKAEGFSSLDFTNSDVLARYMDGVSVNVVPNLMIEDDVTNIAIGSFFCGGNVGSMTYPGVANITLPATITITDKIVAGCNDAVVLAVDQLNALYEGGILGPNATTINGTESKDRVNLTVHSKLSPTLEDNLYTKANIYGGCYNSGVVKGNVEINVNSNIISSVSNNITLIPFDEEYLPASTLSIYGGGYGSETTIYGNTTVNLTGNARVLKVFGGGERGSVLGTATINLISGTVGNVYGGGFAEGYTATSSVNIPDNSTIKANAIFGGALGEDEGRPCDVDVSNVTFASTTATVEDGIYGGNHTARATRQTNVTISVPVKNQHGNLLSIYGAGYGAGTVAGFTNVTLNAGAQVAKVYGGGREGKVYNHYKYCTIDGYPDDRQAIWTSSSTDDVYNTQINIFGTAKGIAHVTGNVYGAGYGENAHTSGKTKVQLLGGTVDGDIYGGGEKGSMPMMTNTTNGFIADREQTIGSLCVIEGGQVRNVFGGGYQGKIEGNSGVSIGTTTGTSFFNGVPTILRSAYGGGEMAEVTGTSTVDMYNGYIGYRHHAAASKNNKYQPELKLNADDEANLLSENGNLYGAGFGEGAVVMNTQVRLYGGTIRNGLYGGGEIASVGSKILDANGTNYIYTYGQTNVYMYGGLVVGDVFGGGRGYSYDLTGNQIVGKTLYIDGYVFGKTNVEIYRGTIGTDESLALGHGNVFGGGNIGYVYSAGVKYTGETDSTKIKGHYYTDTTYSKRTEDCRVHIAAGSYVKSGSVTINDTLYNSGDFVPNRLLNTLTYNDSLWARLDDSGVTIRNAVFAGGNVSAGSDKVYANAVTVFGNATAAVVDVFSRDLVTLGGEHVGGLYGDGNLTFVDGYRELNITNYGTDYYHLNPDYTKKTITQTDYDNLSAREKAYFTAEKGEDDAIQYTISRTSGRMMNTIQRADFCGVLGSRILLHGAQDRVPDVADYTNYTINRVGEVSLNCVTPQGIKSQDNTSQVDASQNEVVHGNYFGIYNVVNLLGALTSDVEFTSDRQASKYTQTTGDSATELTTSESYIPGKTYYEFKDNNYSKGFRNKANSLNMVALASGVYLELIEEEVENKETGEITKTYGPVTGVIELDLINVRTGEGGGYVYAKNEHRAATPITDSNAKKQQTLSTANQGAITQKAFTYTEGSSTSGMQTSGNFVHDDYRIVDDCFPNGGDIKSPAHFWYVIGNYYVYDQKLSAYTGGANAYEQSINIPFTITDGSNGKVQITSIKPNKYFVGAEGVTSYKFAGKEYHLNDIISYWDWTQLPLGESGPRSYFVDMTYIAQNAVSTYQPGDVISEDTYKNLDDDDVKQAFRISNEMSRDNGYLLTYGMTNPLEWDTYFTIETREEGKFTKLLGSDFEKLSELDKEKYLQAPTIQCTESGIYGQRIYNSEDLVSQSVIDEHKLIAESTDSATIDAYLALSNSKPQAQFDSAYVATSEILIGNTSYNVGSYISNTVFTSLTTEQKNAFEQAYLCIRTIEVAEKDYVLNGELISKTRYDQLDSLTSNNKNTYMSGVEISEHFSPAYVCVRQDPTDNDTYYYGGTYFEAGTNYSALDICALSHSDRQAKKTNGDPVFVFNKDALDLFYTNFSDDIKGYGSPYYEENQYLYVDFEATYTGTDTSLTKVDGTFMQIKKDSVLNREAYQQLLNEQAHYVKVTLLEGTNYIVKTQFKHNNTNYLVGTVLDSEAYNSLGENKSYCYKYDNSETQDTAYFCREDYKPLSSTDSITIGTVINSSEYKVLPNFQKNFSIVGRASTETSTLYVPRESDIENLSKDRIITVQLEYVYNENGEEKLENHVVNIHVQFKSGQPTIGSVAPPATILPNTTVGLSVPTVVPGAYEIIGGGWEIFKNENDARAHKNGATYRNNATPMYWYQNGYYVAYFAKTYLGKVYSNPVKFSVANYHRLSEVMNHKVGDKNEYMFIDHEHANRDRAPKIYLDAAGSESAVKNDLDYLADLYNATLQETTEPTTNDAGESVSVTTREVDEQVKGCANLEFILRSDIAPKAYSTWTSEGIIGTETTPFAGNLHGNGYTISGLNNASLFGHLGGKVYNLGVNGGNIANTMAEGGHIENAWVSATGTSPIKPGDNVVNYHFLTNNNAASFAKGEVAYKLNSFYAPNVQYNANGYVEKYFADGDFIYANGTIPLNTDERYDKDSKKYIPIDDDYIFFGQRLTYKNETHGNLPSRINKIVTDQGSEHIDRTEGNSNRVYSAPAYFMSNDVSQVYFNTAANFVDRYKTFDIHKNLTAIDFTGNGDGASKLDIEKLTGFSLGDGLTKNLLVYAQKEEGVNTSYGEISSCLKETPFSISDNNSDNNYKIVVKNDKPSSGLLVTKQGDDYVALTDHFLVDKENFHVPIAYQFADDNRMWYQRTPDRFAEAGNGNGDGWDIICLPFTAELVTTHQKGEITHFYQGSTTNHEYWLREFKSITTENAETNATFARPDKVEGSSYDRTSTFLYDKYYSKIDANEDNYQSYYNDFSEENEYKDYAYLKANKPYIIAFPGQTYHEFDMSGNFVPEHTATSIDKLDKQVVTFVSEVGASIGVTVETTPNNGYNFVGTYQTKDINDINGYLINAAGSAFVKANAESSVPFRGYLTTPTIGGARKIFIGAAAEEGEPQDDVDNRGITVYGRRGGIYIESTLEDETVVTIYRLNGQLVQKVAVQPMGKVFVPVALRGIYIVNRQKVSVL